MVVCRYNSDWICRLFKKKGDKNIVDIETCTLCMKAKEITKASRMLDTAMGMYGEVDTAIRTMNTYTHRLTRALEKLEAE